jgi:DNA-damage-inducible protein J
MSIFENYAQTIDVARKMKYNGVKGVITMAETTNLNIRIDKDLKEHAEAFFADLGLNMTTAFNIFVRQSLKQGRIPFEIVSAPDPFFGAENTRVLEKSARELREGKIVGKTMDELRAME